MATINDLRTKANLVANATAVGENTAGRVGGALQDAADLIAQLLDSVNIDKGADGTRDERITSLQNTLVNLQKDMQDESTNRSAKDEVLQKLITALKNSKGGPDGIAPLDRKGKVPAAHLPSYVDDVIEFDGCMDNLTVQQAGVDMLSTDEHAKVIYNRTDNVFVLAVKTQENENTIYYASWPDQDTYGVSSRNGFAPISGKIYVDTSTNITYRWSGTKLVPIGSDLALGYTAGTAFPGNEGAELKQRYIRDVEILNEDLTDTAQTIREMQSAISTNTTSLNDLTTRVGSMETNSTRTAAVMAAVKTSVEEAKASAEAAKTAAEGVKASTTTDGKTLEDVYTLAKDAANRAPAAQVEIVQATGDAEDKVMSQKAVTEALKGVGGTSAETEEIIEELKRWKEKNPYRLESASVDPNHVGENLIPENKWYGFTHEARYIDGISVKADAATTLHVGKIDVSQKPFKAVELSTHALNAGPNTIFFDNPIGLSDTEYIVIKTDLSVLRNASSKDACLSGITEGADTIVGDDNACPQFSVITDRVKTIEDIFTLQKRNQPTMSLKMRLLPIESVTRNNPYLISIPPYLRKITIKIPLNDGVGYNSYSYRIQMYDKNKRYISDIVDNGSAFDCSQYPTAQFYQFIVEKDKFRNNVVNNKGYLYTLISDADYGNIIQSVEDVFTVVDRNRISYALDESFKRYPLPILPVNLYYAETSYSAYKITECLRSEYVAILFSSSNVNDAGTFYEGPRDSFMFMKNRYALPVVSPSIRKGLERSICRDYFKRFSQVIDYRGDLQDAFSVEDGSYYYYDSNNIRFIVLNQYETVKYEDNSNAFEKVEYNENYPNLYDKDKFHYSEDSPALFNYDGYSFRMKEDPAFHYNLPPHQETECDLITYSEKQLNWFCKTLLETPDGYSIVVVVHAPVGDNMTAIESKFSHFSKSIRSGEFNKNCLETEIIQLILKAYNDRAVLNQNVKYKSNVDFFNTKTDTEGHKYAFNISFDFTHAQGVFNCMVGAGITLNWECNDVILKDENFGFYSIHLSSYKNNYFSESRFGLINITDKKETNSLLRIARIGYDMNDDGSVDDVLELKKD